jgi:hypothetical protein
MILHMQNGVVVGTEKPTPQAPFTLPTSWYRQWRTRVSLGFLLMLLLAPFVQSGLADSALQQLGKGYSYLSFSQFSATNVFTASHATVVNASQQLVRISQLDPAQYNSTDEDNTWAYSACSTASMTEVFNAYGSHYRITDIL